jgi:hypothetical protein
MAPLARDAGTGRLRIRLPLTGLGGVALPRGAVAALLLAAGTAVYNSIHRLDWFQIEVMGVRSSLGRTVVDTLGLAFVVGIAAVVWRGLARARATDAAPLVPLASGVVVAFLLAELSIRAVDVLALLSDPFDRGWDLLGTADWYADPRWASSTTLAWIELAALGLGTILAVVVAHDRGLVVAPGDRRAAERSTLGVVAAVVLLATGALVALLR